MSLYRKYRPQSFANLVGQDHVKTTLLNALKSGNVNHAYLFTGPRGTGKTSTARLLAKAINCENLQNSEPCEQCDICKDISEGRLIDLLEIDAASNRGIDEIRDLREKIQFSPTRAKSKVYIIDEVHMLTKEAFNALLKTLEEPPAHVYFILATTEVHKIPETILSRCQRFDFKRIDNKTLLARLAYICECEKIEAEIPALEMIVHNVQGGLRDAIGLLEQLTVDSKLTLTHVREILGISGKMSIEKLYEFLKLNQMKNGIDEINALYIEGYDLSQFNKDFLEFLRQKMLVSVYENKTQETGWLLKLINFFQQAYEQLRMSTIPQLPLEIAIVQSCLSVVQVAGQVAPTEPQTPPKAIRQSAPITESQTSAKAEPQLATPSSAPSVNTKTEHVLRPEPPIPVVPPVREHQSLQPQALPTFEEIKAKWPRVVEHIQNPVAKRTLSLGKLSSLKDAELVMIFSSKFDHGKMKETTALFEVEKALEAVFHVQINFNPTLEILSTISQSKDDQTSQLLEVFGGELVEEK